MEMKTCHNQRVPPLVYQASQATLDLSVTGNLSSVLIRSFMSTPNDTVYVCHPLHHSDTVYQL